MKSLVLLIYIFVFNLHVHAQEAGVVLHGYVLPNTEERELMSKITNHNYQLLVAQTLSRARTGSRKRGTSD